MTESRSARAGSLSPADKDKRSAALSSVIAAVGLTAIKIVVGSLTNSLGILAEAAHSGLDLLAALVTLFAVRASGKPADLKHPYGHGKVENLSALFETVLLLDNAPDGLSERIRQAVEEIPGIKDCHNLRIRTSGPTTFVDVHILANPYQSLRSAHELTERAERAIRAVAPDADITVHAEPLEVEDALRS